MLHDIAPVKHPVGRYPAVVLNLAGAEPAGAVVKDRDHQTFPLYFSIFYGGGGRLDWRLFGVCL